MNIYIYYTIHRYIMTTKKFTKKKLLMFYEIFRCVCVCVCDFNLCTSSLSLPLVSFLFFIYPVIYHSLCISLILFTYYFIIIINVFLSSSSSVYFSLLSFICLLPSFVVGGWFGSCVYVCMYVCVCVCVDFFML